ncbi:MAG: hypothetical protein HFH36_13360 [Lachnospiraceae bacterium]|nr:hypothetical protein [Lachnospiraceae bacterium]
MSRSEIYPCGDGITRPSDPFWKNTCLNCGHVFWSVLSTACCANCGHPGLCRELGGIPYERIMEERGRQADSGKIRICQSKSE